MKATFLLILPAAAALAVMTPAQHPMGFSAGWDQPPLTPGGTTFAHNPQTLQFAEGDFLTRIDHDDYRDWGLDPAVDPSYGTFCMVGMEFVTEDPDPVTPEFPFWLTGWTEDAAKPNFPDLPNFPASNFLFAGPIYFPVDPTATTSQALLWTITLPSICVPTGSDIFLGINIGPVGVGEGLFTHGVNDENIPLPSPTLFDNPGPGGPSIPESSYVCVVPTETFLGNPPPPPLPLDAPAVYSFYMAQNRLEVYVQNSSGGVCTTVTNQESYVASNPETGNGTPNFLSGLHPDASSLPVNAGRDTEPPAGWTGDRLGFVYSDSRLVAGNPVLVFVSFVPAIEPIRIKDFGLFGTNSSGRLLMSFLDLVQIGLGVAELVDDDGFPLPDGSSLPYGRYSLSIEVSGPVRDFLQTEHPVLLWQGFGLDSQGNLHATGLARQHL